MLTLDDGLSREQKNILLGQLRTQLANYFGFMTSGSLGMSLAYAQAGGQAQTQTELDPTSGNREQVRRTLSVRADPINSKVFEMFLDAGVGAIPSLSSSANTKSYKDRLSDYLNFTSAIPQEEKTRITNKVAQCVAMHFDKDARVSNAEKPEGDNPRIIIPDLGDTGMFKTDSDQLKLKDRISAFEMLHPFMQQGEKNAELLSVFFNAMPTIEMTRATPVLDIKIYSSRQVEQDGKLGAITLHKFLEGAATIPFLDDNPLRAINLASQVTSSMFGDTEQDFQNYSLVGMELFRAPQTLQNIEATKNTNNYLAPVIDPMRPLASIKSLEIEVVPTVGLMSSKTAKLEIILHDRSRLGEFADFVKPDRYGSSFIDIEYGWSHPDGIVDDSITNVKNPYAQMLNLIRVKEHYGISKSNFSFDQVGQVNITLNLFTRGTAEIAEISIADNAPNIKENLKKLRDFSIEVNRLSGLLFNRPSQQGSSNSSESQTVQHRSEIRGHQALSAISDSENMLLINDDLFTSLRELRQTLGSIRGNGNATQSTQSQNARELERKIDAIIGPSSGRQQQSGQQAGGLVHEIQNSINESIRQTMSHINANDHEHPAGQDAYTYDIFLKRMPTAVRDRLQHADTRHAGLRAENAQTSQLASFNPTATGTTRSASPRRAHGTARSAAPAAPPAATPAAPAAVASVAPAPPAPPRPAPPAPAGTPSVAETQATSRIPFGGFGA